MSTFKLSTSQQLLRWRTTLNESLVNVGKSVRNLDFQYGISLFSADLLLRIVTIHEFEVSFGEELELDTRTSSILRAFHF